MQYNTGNLVVVFVENQKSQQRLTLCAVMFDNDRVVDTSVILSRIPESFGRPKYHLLRVIQCTQQVVAVVHDVP